MKAITILLLLTFHLKLFSQENGIRLIYSSHSTCDGSEDIERIRQRIISQSFSNDTLLISLGIIAECSLDDPLIKITRSNDTLYFKIRRRLVPAYDSITKDTTYSLYLVECDCCYQFDLKIAGLPHKNYYVIVNNIHVEESNEKYKIYPIRYDLTPNGDTINYVDKYGLRQGLWERRYKSGGFDIIRYKNGKPYSFKKHYPNGQLKCDCICRLDHDGDIEFIEETGDCKYWDINGKEIK